MCEKGLSPVIPGSTLSPGLRIARGLKICNVKSLEFFLKKLNEVRREGRKAFVQLHETENSTLTFTSGGLKLIQIDS